MRILVSIAYMILGLFQLAAIMAGLEDWIGLHWIISILLAFFVAYIPVLGTVLGMYGAVTAWDWTWPQASGLFFGPFLAIVLLSISISVLESRREDY